MRRGSSSCVRARTSPRASTSTRRPTQIVREGDPIPAADVYVVRDAHLHPWMQAAADVDGVVVVEAGLPVWRPERARGYVATFGAGRASLDAAAELLREEVPA